MKTAELLAAVKRHHNLPSDYALAKFLGVSQPTTSKWSTGRALLDDDHAIRVADLLDLPHGYVLAMIEEERAERMGRAKVRVAWRDVKRALAPALAAATVGILALQAPESRAEGSVSVYYVKRRRRQILLFPETVLKRSRPRQLQLPSFN